MMRVGLVRPLTVAQQLEEVEPPVTAQTMRGVQGKPVVFLHGYGGTPNDSIGPSLASALRRAGVALDITAPWVEPKRQRGDSVVSFAPTTLTFELAQIQKLADQTDGKLTLIGHSFGGLGARVYATLHPEKVEKLVLLMPGEGVARNTAKDYGADATDPAEVERQLRQVIQQGEGELADARADGNEKKVADLAEQLNWLTMCADIIGYDAKAPIRDLNVPTLLVRAGDDGNLSAGQVMSVARQARGPVDTLVVPGANHMLEGKTAGETKSNYDLVAKAIGKFLGEGEKGARDEFAPGEAPKRQTEPAGELPPQADDDELFSN